LPSHTSAKWGDPKSQAAQYFEQESILFEAVSSSTIQNQLLKDGIRFEADGPAKQNVEIFEWN
jgi:hypothetical protein